MLFKQILGPNVNGHFQNTWQMVTCPQEGSHQELSALVKVERVCGDGTSLIAIEHNNWGLISGCTYCCLYLVKI